MINIPVMKKDEPITLKRFKEIIAENVGKFVLCNQKEIDKQGSQTCCRSVHTEPKQQTTD